MSTRNVKVSFCPQSIVLANSYTGNKAVKDLAVARRQFKTRLFIAVKQAEKYPPCMPGSDGNIDTILTGSNTKG